MMNAKNIGLAAAAAAGAVMVIAGGTAIANSGQAAGIAVAAQVAPAAVAAGSSSPSTTAPPTSVTQSAQSGSSAKDGPGEHTPVTGAELTRVSAAVKAKDAAVTVTGVRKDADGSYDVFGTKAGAPVRVEVSKDLKSVTVEAGHGAGKGHGGAHHTPVTGAELTRVSAAVKAKDAAVTVTGVRKDADGSYDVFGTKAGAPVRVEVSKDLKSVTVEAGHGAGKGHGGAHHTPVTGSELTKVSAAVKAKDAAVTVTTVRKDADGSYDAFGTKAGAPVRVEVSKDLNTVRVLAGGGHGGHR